MRGQQDPDPWSGQVLRSDAVEPLDLCTACGGGFARACSHYFGFCTTAAGYFLREIKVLLPISKSKYTVIAAILMEMLGNYILQSRCGSLKCFIERPHVWIGLAEHARRTATHER
jgi:hypothetical protein